MRFKIIAITVIATVFVFECVAFFVLLCQPRTFSSLRDPNSYVTVDEIYQNPDNMQVLYNLLGNKEGATYDSLHECITSKGPYDAKIISRLSLYKEKNKDIQVVFGGLTWQVCYLSLTGEEGDSDRELILTLMLSDCLTQGQWHGWVEPDPNLLYPSNMYGTSYLRAVVLNNGGGYAANSYDSELTVANQDAGHLFARFTMNKSVLPDAVTDAIVKPNVVSWQEHQAASAVFTTPERFYQNEAWGVPSKTIQNSGSVADYATKTNYDIWKNDYLWLPSWTEYGASRKGERGLWQLTEEQRSINQIFWLRSAYCYSGSSVNCVNIKKQLIGYDPLKSYGIRPALHLKLSADSLKVRSALAA